MIDALTRVCCTWNSEGSRCRVAGYDGTGRLLGEVLIELPPEVRERIWSVKGHAAQARIEEIAERHLRAMLELRA